MINKNFFKIAGYCLFFLGLAFSWSCQNPEETPQTSTEREEARRKAREERRLEREAKEKARKEEAAAEEAAEEEVVEEGGDVNVEINVIGEAENTESSEGARNNITNNSVLILTIDKDNPDLDDYGLWECQKTDLVVSYFLNKNPNTIDDEGTSEERKRLCELFKINTVKNNDPDIKLINWAHYEKDFCEKKLTESLTAREEEGFNCKKIEDISFLFNEE